MVVGESTNHTHSSCPGLRSPRVGEQCEAIVRFPALVDRFPFPVLINAAFLKISDIFRTGYKQ